MTGNLRKKCTECTEMRTKSNWTDYLARINLNQAITKQFRNDLSRFLQVCSKEGGSMELKQTDELASNGSKTILYDHKLIKKVWERVKDIEK